MRVILQILFFQKYTKKVLLPVTLIVSAKACFFVKKNCKRIKNFGI